MRTMGRFEFYDYLKENFELENAAWVLVNNILSFTQMNFKDMESQQCVLFDLLDGIGLETEEIKQVYL